MHYCYMKDLDPNFDNEIDYAKKIGKYLLWDEESEKFYDEDGNLKNIKGLTILGLSDSTTDKQMAASIIREGGTSICSPSELEITRNWRDFIETKRKSGVFTREELLNEEIIENIRKNFSVDNCIYIKTIEKELSKIIRIEELIESDGIMRLLLEEICEKEEKFIISEPVEI